MILVGKYPSVKLTNHPYSLFIKFDYNQYILEKVKSLPVRKYEPNNKVWEVPITDIDRVVNLFGRDNIKLFNEFPEFEQYLTESDARAHGKKSVKELVEYYKNLTPEVDYNFKTKPNGHQIESFNTALHLDSLFITDEMGMGKSKQALDIMDYKKSKGLVKHVLIICGINSVKYNWHDDEIPKHSRNNCQVIDGTKKQRIEKIHAYWQFFYNIINIESLRDEDIRLLLSKLCTNGNISGIIFDEFHKANNHKSQQGKGLRELQVPYKIALSGTPITKRIEKSWSMLNWMGFEEAKYWDFVQRYCVLGGYTGWEPTGDYKNLDELHNRFDKYQIRRTKDLLELPPKTYKNVYVEMTRDEHNEYMEIKRGIIRDIESGDVKMVNPAVATIKLRMFTDKVKCRAIKDIVEELNDNNSPALIFSMYKQGLYTLEEDLKQYNPLLLTGDIKDTADKQAIIRKFQEEKSTNYLMGTIQAMGTGFTLTRAQYVIFMNKMWSCKENDQAEDRAHRIGTTGTVTIISVLVKNSVDERVEQILANDRAYIDKVVDGIPISGMSNEEIFNILMQD